MARKRKRLTTEERTREQINHKEKIFYIWFSDTFYIFLEDFEKTKKIKSRRTGSKKNDIQNLINQWFE